MHREGDPRPTWGREERPTRNYSHKELFPPGNHPFPWWVEPSLHWVEPQNDPFPLQARRDQPYGVLEAPFHLGNSPKWFQELIQDRGTKVSVGLGTHPQLFTAIRLETRTKG